MRRARTREWGGTKWGVYTSGERNGRQDSKMAWGWGSDREGTDGGKRVASEREYR